MEYSQWITHIQTPRVERLLKTAAQTNIISFAGGLPADELFPAREIQESFQRVIAEKASEALQYNWSEGYEPLREQIAGMMRARGIDANSRQVLVTHGAQQALDLLAKLLIAPGESIGVENPTYLPALQAFETRDARLRPISRSHDGLDFQAVEAALRGPAKFFYCVATGHNPTGAVLNQQERTKLARLCADANVPIIEDDAYGFLQYDGYEKPLKCYESEGQPTIYVGSFSKILTPGMRVGWILAPEKLIREVSLVKQAADLQTATLNQVILSAYLETHSIQEHVARCVQFYRERRDCMLKMLKQEFGPEAAWTRPASGFSVWLRLPPECSGESLLSEAVDEGIAFEPGRPFFVENGRDEFIRLSYSNQPLERIEAGVRILARVLKKRSASAKR